jgi:predicted thioesterase
MTFEKFARGQSAETVTKVTADLCINRMGRAGAEVLSTPSLLHLMELTAIEASEPYLPAGHTTVGYAVDGLRHLAATPLGGTVTVKAVLTEVDRNRLTYDIEAYEGDQKIGVATHKRAIISTEA